MSNRIYTFAFDEEDMHVATSDGMFSEDEAANILYWFVTETKPHAPLAALGELHEMVRKELLNQRGKENNN